MIENKLPFSIPGVDIESGIVYSGGTMEFYIKVLSIFCIDVKERLPLIQIIPDDSNITKFYTHIHALKSSFASIGAKELSDRAALLETDSRNNDFKSIKNNLADFVNRIIELENNITKILESYT